MNAAMIKPLARTGLEVIHVSIHFPEHGEEATRVIKQIRALKSTGIGSGVNLLVEFINLELARKAWERIHAAGIGPERVILLPMRLHADPAPADVRPIASRTWTAKP